MTTPAACGSGSACRPIDFALADPADRPPPQSGPHESASVALPRDVMARRRRAFLSLYRLREGLGRTRSAAAPVEVHKCH